ncbi:MAG TPA: hypothetical protein VLB44_06805 [Kofleriaceae bacterium]|nr:hypothetical protein [Kofleriaceae bacterium]
MKASILVALATVAGCGNEIGDACISSSDCSPNGDRVCDVSSREGYCTIQGCDESSCPDEATCIRFFTGSFANKACDPTVEESGCSLDELCSLNGRCVPRSAEVRYCMKTCSSDDDCRSGYECRDVEKMKEHGGEPVLPSGKSIEQAAKFCASRPAS